MTLFKTSLSALFFLLTFTSFTAKKHFAEDKIIEVYFSDKLEITDLAEIKNDLEKNGIKLQYKSLQFGEDGKLSQIDFFVRAGKFGGGDATSDTKTAIGFIINRSPGSKYGIIVGKKESIQKRKAVLESQN